MNSLPVLFQDKQLQSEIEKYSRKKHLGKDDILMETGDSIQFIPLVQAGVLRIMRQDTDGNEVFLYHLYPGQTCAMALNCCQSSKKSMVKAIAEDETDVVLIPVEQIEDWYKYPEWRSFVNSTYGNRFSELLNVIDLIAFNNLDKQLLHYLQQRTKAVNTNALYITHQEIADELHTHREVISRLLRTMEEKKMVLLGRHTVELLVD
ncbi:MAG: Crp/Fnr family transcriptional regulator [Bacteroidetes bacterium]|jgi:CRP/FNR family transcriptional regulator|nr:Crp/Fnr family transcriptional regulator [Bacteroidota bacterium]MBP6401555.1 Crp/Fnr family transcriptional regulator [Bacteroidia bacterium]MBK9526554.1 Crp/Fnr family transcriptional regulator [Bacteroidota bacterium]MBK9542642.1 Crp/Fnr family transcriptional regulator [Bacteroidota bacterium]MBL0256977.1 Crp/Fnr family transcriptional regulator [Bacteroidota bacterium]